MAGAGSKDRSSIDAAGALGVLEEACSIQPHGVLIALDRSGRLTHASQNAREIFPRLPAFGDPVLWHDLSREVAIGDIIAAVTGQLCSSSSVSPMATEAIIGGEAFDVIVHGEGAQVVAEFERRIPDCEADSAIPLSALQAVANVQWTGGVKAILARAVSALQELTRLDQVLAFRFDAEGGFEVIAEAFGKRHDSHLGRRFPASDLSAQERRLFARNRVRWIADDDAEQIAIDGHDQHPVVLDLTRSVLRSAGKRFNGDLATLRTKTSLDISVKTGGTLWGFIGCYGDEPRQMPYRLRLCCDALAQVVSAAVQQADGRRRDERLHAERKFCSSLSARFFNGDSAANALDALSIELRTLFDSDAILTPSPEGWRSSGSISLQAAAELRRWLARQSDHVLATSSATPLPPSLQLLLQPFCHLLAIRIDPAAADWVILMRDRTAQSRVTGNLGMSRRWDATDLAMAQSLGRALFREAILRRETEERLIAQAQARFIQMIADRLPARISYWDADGHCCFVNRDYCAWRGMATIDLLGRIAPDAVATSQEVLIASRLANALAGHTQRFELEEIDSNGERSTFLHQYVPDSQNGAVRGYVALSVDVTSAYLAHLALQNLNQELVTARDQAEAAVCAKTAFLSNTSHEIRTPMNAIIGLTHLLRHDIKDGINGERLTRVADAAQHLLSLINRILDLSKIEAGKLVLEHIEFSLDALLLRSFNLVAEAARAKGLELVLDTDGVPGLLRGDPTRLSQVLVNLLGNAVKFTQKGIVSLRANLLEQDEQELLVRFSVHDTGRGIPTAQIPKLFETFEQGDSSTTRHFGGTGLGLAITRHLAQLMGGEAGVVSEPGVGSTFWITVRLHASKPGGDRPREPLLEGVRVLLVDDIAEAREAIGHMLDLLGMRADLVASGEEAFAKVDAAIQEGDPYAAVLIDWLMPRMNGIDAARGVLARCPNDPPECVLISVSRDEQLREEASALGIECLLQKPISFSTLRDRLVALLVYQEPTSQAGELDTLSEEALRLRVAGSRLLIVEDNLVNQEVAKSLLELVGLTVDVANDGLEALAMAESGSYALILMDIQMPHLDGLEATRRLRASPHTSQVPIVAMTANTYAEDRAAALAAGMNDFLSKPVDPSELYAALERWLSDPP